MSYIYIPPIYYIRVYVCIFFPRSLLQRVFFRVLQFLSTVKKKLLKKPALNIMAKDMPTFKRKGFKPNKLLKLFPQGLFSYSYRQNVTKLLSPFQEETRISLENNKFAGHHQPMQNSAPKRKYHPGSNPQVFSLPFPRQIKGSAHYS